MGVRTNDLIFTIVCPDDTFPDLLVGPRGQELSVFFPAGSAATQLGYGQGEGQVLIDGREWGFYYDGGDGMDVVLHESSLSRAEALPTVVAICEALEERFGVGFSVKG